MQSTAEAAAVWGLVWDFGRIWPYKRLWEALIYIRTCLQPYWRVPPGPSLLQWQWPRVTGGVCRAPRAGLGLGTANQLWPKCDQLSQGAKGRCAEQQGQNGAAHGREEQREMLPWHCTGSLVIPYFTYLVLLCFPGLTAAASPEERFLCSTTVSGSWWLQETQLLRQPSDFMF